MTEDSTLQNVIRAPGDRRARWVRRATLSLLFVVVLIAATGLLGVHAETVSASGVGGYRLTLTYPRVARAGLDVPWELRLYSPAGFHKKITVAISADYYDIFEFQGMHPEPSDETGTARFVYLTFSPPQGTTFTTSLDTYVQPSAQLGRSATTAVLVGKRKVAEVHYKTWLVP